MAEYIEREALVSDLEFLVRHQDGFRQSVILGVVHTIKCVPAADAVPVVRCKDCAWRGTAGCPYNAFDRRVERPDNGFCSDGERKENKYDPA